jgi:hypothetical protein
MVPVSLWPDDPFSESFENNREAMITRGVAEIECQIPRRHTRYVLDECLPVEDIRQFHKAIANDESNVYRKRRQVQADRLELLLTRHFHCGMSRRQSSRIDNVFVDVTELVLIDMKNLENVVVSDRLAIISNICGFKWRLKAADLDRKVVGLPQGSRPAGYQRKGVSLSTCFYALLKHNGVLIRLQEFSIFTEAGKEQISPITDVSSLTVADIMDKNIDDIACIPSAKADSERHVIVSTGGGSYGWSSISRPHFEFAKDGG